MSRFCDGKRVSKSGNTLHTVKYLPERERPKAAFCFHHGLGEHVGRYNTIFQKMADSGIAVFSGDVIGHGKSSGERVYFGSLDQLIEDFACLCQDAKNECDAEYNDPPIPMFIGGHSLGGMIAPLVCLKNQALWAGLLLLSPSLDVEWTFVLRTQAFFGNVLSSLAPKFRVVPKIKTEHLNKDAMKVKEYEEDELVYCGPLPARTANETLKGFSRLSQLKSEFVLPIYAHHGTADRVTLFNATKAFLSGVSSKDVKFIPVENGYHEVLFEEHADSLLQGIIQWIIEHASKNHSRI